MLGYILLAEKSQAFPKVIEFHGKLWLLWPGVDDNVKTGKT